MNPQVDRAINAICAAAAPPGANCSHSRPSTMRRDYDWLPSWRGSAGRRTTLRFSILGPLEINDDAGRRVTVTRRLHRSALSLLLLHAGRPCSGALLAAGLWGDEPPLSPEVSLRSCVYGIRKVLPDAGRLKTHPSGYLITVGPSE